VAGKYLKGFPLLQLGDSREEALRYLDADWSPQTGRSFLKEKRNEPVKATEERGLNLINDL
jgi:hypothetical protein